MATTKATSTTGGTASLARDSSDVINALAKNGTAELNVTNGSKVTLEVGNVITYASDGTTVATAKMDGQKIISVRFTNAESGDIGFGGSEVVGQNVAIQDSIVNVAGITNSSEVLYKYGANGGDIIDLTSTTKKGTIKISKTGDAKFVVANDVNSVEGGTDLTIGGTAFAFTDAGNNGGVFITADNKVTGFIFRDINDALTVKKGQTEPELYEIPTSSAMNVKSKSGNESFAGIKKATLPFKVTSTGADYTITKTADGYSIEIGEGETVIANGYTGAKISMIVPPASNSTVSSVVLNFNEYGQLDSITNGAASGGKENTGLSGSGAALYLFGFSGSDVAGGSLQIGDISISIPEEDYDICINYAQEVITIIDPETDEEKTITAIMTNADIGAKDDDDPTAEANPYIVTRGAGVPDSVLPTYLKDDGGIYGIILPEGSNISVTGPFDGITELGGYYWQDNMFSIDPKTAQTNYTFGSNNGTLKFAGLKDGDTIVIGSGIGEFITSEEGTFDVLGTTMTITGDSEVVFTATDGAVTGLAYLNGTAKGNFVSKVLSVNYQSVQVKGDEDKIVAVTGNDTGITAVTELNGKDVNVISAGNATQIGDTSDGKLTLSYAGGGTVTIAGNGSEQTFFNLDGTNIASIIGLNVGETVSGILDNVSNVNGKLVTINNYGNVTTVANIAGKLQINGNISEAPEPNPLLITGTEKADKLKETLDGATIQAFGGKDIIRSYGDAVSIDAGAGNDSIRNYGDDVTILGGTGNDTIRNNGDTALIDAGKGNDMIRNYGDAVTLTGGKGNDVIRNYGEEIMIQYANGDGNDSIVGFDETSTLNIAGTYSTTKSGKNIIVTVGKGKITLSGAASLETLNVFRTATLTDKNSSKVTLSANVIGVDATARTKAIRLVGNALDNTILGGTGKDTLYGKDGNDYIDGSAGNDKLYGQNGDDTLIGGAGNDSLWGADGSDTFIYAAGDGKDVIVGFDNTDMLEISEDWTATYNNTSKAVAFKVGDTANAITLKSFTATTFNINGDTYKISGTTLVKK